MEHLSAKLATRASGALGPLPFVEVEDVLEQEECAS